MTRSIRRALVVLSVLLLGMMQVQAASTHTNHPACGTSCSHDTAHTSLSAASWSPSYVLSGDRYMTSDITVARDITVSGSARLCLNGNTLTFTEGYGLRVKAGASLELCDCRGTGGIVYDYTGGGSGAIINQGTLTIYGGQYCTDGKGYGLDNSGTLTIYGG
ncbi:MAG: hypothetical protein IJ042_09775, partial [Butyricicoccus sp.]|nr:hypothetical protein [Butyricicoccus sp.]